MLNSWERLFCIVLTASCAWFLIEAAPVINKEVKPGSFSEVLNSTNFNGTVYNSEFAWLVEFYMDWCGHCRGFAPTWKALALDIADWRNVKMGAVSCVSYLEVCRSHNISSVPRVLFFPANSTLGSTGKQVQNLSSIHTIKSGAIFYLEQEQENTLAQGKKVEGINLTPYTEPQLLQFLETTPPSVKHNFLIFEEANSTLGAEIILDFQIYETVHIRRVLPSNKNLTNLFKIQNLPSLAHFLPNQTHPHHISQNTTKTQIDSTIRETASLPKTKTQPRTREPIKPLEIVNPNIKDKLYLKDLEFAVHYSLNHEIGFSGKPIEAEKLKVLRNYVKILSKYLPLSRKTKKFLDTFEARFLENATEVTIPRYREFWNLTESELETGFEKPFSWVGCKGSSEKFRGYTCGLWTVFHTLTVNSATGKNGGNGTQVLLAIYDYVREFFVCSDCREHFLKMAEENDIFGVKSGDEAVLWLWKAHNQVNERLAGDSTEDPAHKKIQYPAAENCKNCRKENGDWDEDRVLEYLKGKYGVDEL